MSRQRAQTEQIPSDNPELIPFLDETTGEITFRPPEMDDAAQNLLDNPTPNNAPTKEESPTLTTSFHAASAVPGPSSGRAPLHYDPGPTIYSDEQDSDSDHSIFRPIRVPKTRSMKQAKKLSESSSERDDDRTSNDETKGSGGESQYDFLKPKKVAKSHKRRATKSAKSGDKSRVLKEKKLAKVTRPRQQKKVFQSKEFISSSSSSDEDDQKRSFAPIRSSNSTNQSKSGKSKAKIPKADLIRRLEEALLASEESQSSENDNDDDDNDFLGILKPKRIVKTGKSKKTVSCEDELIKPRKRIRHKTGEKEKSVPPSQKTSLVRRNTKEMRIALERNAKIKVTPIPQNLTAIKQRPKTPGQQTKPPIPEEDRVICKKCPITFTTRGNMRRHMREKHGKAKIFSCAICDLKCTLERNLKEHYKTAHSDNPNYYICHVCGKGYLRRQTLHKHVITYHNEEN